VSSIQLITYISASGDGHHDDYDRLFAAAASDIGASLHIVSRSSSVAKRPGAWFYSMFDTKPGATARALIVTFLRSLAGKKTIGLLFRPGDCFIEQSPISYLRRKVFGVVSRLRNVHIVSIVPFYLSPELSSVATSWIYDPQLWDLPYLGVPELRNVQPLQAQAQRPASNRLLVVALGRQNRLKGFDFLVDLWVRSPELRASHLFVACGRVDRESRAAAKRFQEAGGVLLDRRINDAELFWWYRNSDLVWSCYSPDYDQSSGIHGRAVQLGVPVVVRKGSYIDALSETLSHPSLALPFGQSSEAISMISQWNPRRVKPAESKALVLRMQNHSLSVLSEALISKQRT